MIILNMLIPTQIKSQFLLDPSVTFLNFGSFGACPRPVFERYQQYQLELEREPVQFIAFKANDYLEHSRKVLGNYLNCAADDLVYVTNPSYAVNIVARSLDLVPGDEILSTNLEYGACEKAWDYCCEKAGARFVRSEISLPLSTKERFIENFFAALSSRTRMIFISHITSSTALKLPVEEVCSIARQKGIPVFIDGAHAPGQIPLNLSSLGADIYTGACHKWMLAPKGCSFLYASKNIQDRFDPLVVSWGYKSAAPSSSRFIDYHQNQGTRDFSAFLCVEEAVRFMEKYKWREVSARCRALVSHEAERFRSLLKSSFLCEPGSEFAIQMLSLPVNTPDPEGLQAYLFRHYKIEIPVMRHGEHCFLRYSINGFNTQDDLDRLYEALAAIIAEKKLITPGQN